MIQEAINYRANFYKCSFASTGKLFRFRIAKEEIRWRETKMKLLIVLLACIAATNAAYCTYSYSHFYKNNLCISPPTTFYHYRIYFRDAWCSYNYYAPIFKYYPNDRCGQPGWKEASVDDLKVELENCLSESLYKIVAQMVAERTKWIQRLDECHAEFKMTFKNYMSRYYAYKIQCACTEAEKQHLRYKRDEKIKEYNDMLDQKRAEVIQKYNEALKEKIYTIKLYHKTIVDKAVKCLENRLEKIAEYQQELIKRIAGYVNAYWKYLVSVVKCRSEQYRKSLESVHGKNWMIYKINDLIKEFEEKECYSMKYKLMAYSSKLYSYKAKLMTFYRCSYRCTVTNTLRFYRTIFYNSCRSIGQWFCYDRITLKTARCIGPFKYRWYKPTYKCLKTCNLGKLHKPVKDLKEELEEKLDANIKAIVQKFVVWKTKWIQYHIEYCAKYNEIIRLRHECVVRDRIAYFVCLNNSQNLTWQQKAAVEQLRNELKDKREKAVLEYKLQLGRRLVKCVTEFNASIAEYKEKTEKMIKSITDKYSECLATRDDKILEYRKQLEQTRYRQRAALAKHMGEAKNCHFDAYVDMLKSFSGQDLTKCSKTVKYYYAYDLMYYCDDVLSDFDSCWSTLLEQLVRHYSCSYRCRVGCFSMPTYCWGSYYSWRVRYPTAPCYQYYYKRYTVCYSYRIRYVKGSYRYCA